MIAVRTASIVSHVFNPAIIAAFTFLTLLYAYNIASPALVGISLIFATFIPLGIIYLLSRLGLISDFFVSEKRERTKPFAGAIASYLAGSFALWSVGAPTIVTALMLCYAGNTLVLMLITRVWKISVHASGIAGPATALTMSLGAWASIFFALLVPVGWARIRLGAHTPTQMLAGALVTVVTTWVQLKVYFAIL